MECDAAVSLETVGVFLDVLCFVYFGGQAACIAAKPCITINMLLPFGATLDLGSL